MSDDDARSGSDSEEEEIPQEEKDETLFLAVKGGDLKGVVAALESGADPKHTGGDGWTSPVGRVQWGGRTSRHADRAPYNAAEPYVAKGQGSAAGFGAEIMGGGKGGDDEVEEKTSAAANTPLQWAAYKGHAGSRGCC